MTAQNVYPRDRRTLEDYRILKARGLTTDAIAKQLGMSRTTLWRIVTQAGR